MHDVDAELPWAEIRLKKWYLDCVEGVSKSLSCEDDRCSALASYASSALSNMYAALEAYHEKVRSLFGVIVAMLGGAGVAAYYGVEATRSSEGVSLLGSAALLVLVAVVAHIGYGVCRAAYEMYASAVVHATIVHDAVARRGRPQSPGTPPRLFASHPWFAYVHRLFAERRHGWFSETESGARSTTMATAGASKFDRRAPGDVLELVASWRSAGTTLHTYRLLLVCISIAAILAALGLILFASKPLGELWNGWVRSRWE
jgi:hypothetical protein